MLSNKLLDAGWFCALGSTEISYSPVDGRKPVERNVGMARRYDYNNGMNVIYDEQGRPWIMPAWRMEVTGETVNLLELGVRERGAFVPHSNDGGTFSCTILPGLMGWEPPRR